MSGIPKSSTRKGMKHFAVMLQCVLTPLTGRDFGIPLNVAMKGPSFRSHHRLHATGSFATNSGFWVLVLPPRPRRMLCMSLGVTSASEEKTPSTLARCKPCGQQFVAMIVSRLPPCEWPSSSRHRVREVFPEWC